MLVKCRICKNKIERNEAYKVVVKDKNQYYCNAEEFSEWNRENENRMKSIDLIFELIGETTNTSLMKELSQIAKVHSYTKIANYLETNMFDLDISMNKEFETEYGKIRYLMAIVKNSIADFKEKEDENEEIVPNVDFVEEVKYRPTKKKSFADFIDEY